MTWQDAAFHNHYARPDLDDVRKRAGAFAAECAAASSAEVVLGIVSRWNELRSSIDTHKNIAEIRYHQDTRNSAAKKELDFWDDASPVLRELNTQHARAVLDNRFRSAIEEKYGTHISALKECEAATFAPEITNAIADEARLRTRYIELMAKPEAEFRGDKLGLPALAKYYAVADRQTRLEAQQARDGFLSANADELDDIFDELVKLRDQMGKALGYDNFVPLAYKLLYRSDYGPDEVTTFRDEILREVVPVASGVMKQRTERLGVDKLLFYDESCMDTAGNPRPKGTLDDLVAGARTMYHRLGDDLGAFIDMMIDEQLLDLESRDGKAGGGFCTILADLGRPFVFANCNGTDDDVSVFTHECGHAFQMYSSRNQPLLEYLIPGYEAAEVHSMSMEWLTQPMMDLLFEPADALRFNRLHLESVITLLPYIGAVDEFQHRIYSEPGLSPTDRKSLWLELETQYLPWRDYGNDLPYLAGGGLWQRQKHIYEMPFYYIDYALAETCAMQFWRKAVADRDQAMADYRTICSVGGSVSFRDMLAAGNVRSPFETGCLQGLMQVARDELGL